MKDVVWPGASALARGVVCFCEERELFGLEPRREEIFVRKEVFFACPLLEVDFLLELLFGEVFLVDLRAIHLLGNPTGSKWEY